MFSRQTGFQLLRGLHDHPIKVESPSIFLGILAEELGIPINHVPDWLEKDVGSTISKFLWRKAYFFYILSESTYLEIWKNLLEMESITEEVLEGVESVEINIRSFDQFHIDLEQPPCGNEGANLAIVVHTK
eukprot:maker-scaffold943_size78273-snap-gene-0.8 protein:Tk07641 transcript:maker-scaffold943_size78273-snap-gene-0.8-mRNA-1 annotation:"hypothetical protein ACD_34C00363G0002"